MSYCHHLEGHEEFNHSKERIAFAWSNYHLGNINIADQNFQAMDVRFGNYESRIEYAKFLNETDKTEESQVKLQVLLDEINAMDPNEKKSKRAIKQQITSLLGQFSK